MECSDPKGVELFARYSATHGRKVLPIMVRLEVRCRKCEWCKMMRSRFWTGRAISECGQSARNLFGTLTLSPEQHAIVDASAFTRLAKQGVNFDGLPEREKFSERCKEIGGYIDLWLNDIRKGDAAHGRLRYRYLLVAEAHNGAKTTAEMRDRPHFHILMHEIDNGGQLLLPHELYVNKQGQTTRFASDDALLKRKWSYGHSKFEIAKDVKSAVYLCKYLNKSATQVRVRASQKYGVQR